MSGTRSYEFLTGIETSNIPAAVDPTTSDDVMSKGYADNNYTPRSHVYGKVTDITALKAIASANRFNEQLCYVAGLNLFYEFDSASTGTPDDDLIVQPNTGTGRWLKVTFAGGGGSGGGSGVEQLLQKLELEKSGLFTESLDNSLGASGMVQHFTDTVIARLLKDTSSGATSIEPSFNPVYLNDSDKDTNATTNWTATGAGATLTTNGTTKQIGSASLQFDKNGTAVEAAIRYDRGSQNLSLGANSIAQFYINLPSITNLSNVFVRVYADTTSNYRTWTKTTDVSGTSLATGWNLIRVDLSNTSGSTTGGTGWTYNTLSRYVEIGVTTSSAAQTYTAILLDSVMFSLSEPQKLGLNGSEVTLYDTSNRQEIILDISNTLYDTRLSLKSGQSLSNSYTGGVVSAAAAGVERMSTTTSNGVIGFNSTLSSGTIATTQELRLQRHFRESQSMSLKIATDVTTPQWAKVTAVGGSTIDIDDAGNLSANYANTNTIHVFRPKYSANGEMQFDHIADKSLTASSTHSAGTTTLTCNVASIAVGDYIAKNHLNTYQSVVAANANENFASASFDASPNGITVIDNFLSYPYTQNIVAHYPLGGVNSLIATKNKKGNIDNLSIAGSPVYSQGFLAGQFSASFPAGTSYFSLNASQSTLLSSTYTAVFSFWFNDTTGFTGSLRYLMTKQNASNGWILRLNSTTNQINLFAGGGAYVGSSTYTPNRWNHLLCVFTQPGTQMVYLNGASQYVANNNLGAGNTGDILYIGSDSSNGSIGVYFGDMVCWSNPGTFTTQQIQNIYNNGNYRPFEQGGIRYTSTVSGLSGQKASIKQQLSRTTTAVSPSILKTGAIKS